MVAKLREEQRQLVEKHGPGVTLAHMKGMAYADAVIRWVWVGKGGEGARCAARCPRMGGACAGAKCAACNRPRRQTNRDTQLYS